MAEKRKKRKENAASIKDVARAAGVSPATVSFVLNKRPDKTISLGVKNRVAEMARRLDYRPHGPARALASKKTRNIALIFYGGLAFLYNVFYTRVIAGMASGLMARQYQLVFDIVPHEYKGKSEMPDIVASRSVDGVVNMGLQSRRFVDDVMAAGLPMVCVDPSDYDLPVPKVTVDNRKGSRLVVEHLVALGHRSVGLLLGELDHDGVRERNQAYLKALREAGVGDPPRVSKDLRYHNYMLGYDGAKELLAKKKDTTALIVTNDEMALGAVYAAQEMGRNIPRDLSVVGFDDIEESGTRLPTLSTVNVPRQRMGELGVSMLLDIIEGREVPPREVLDVSLEKRASSGRPGRKGG